jgi:hypothetical protein
VMMTGVYFQQENPERWFLSHSWLKKCKANRLKIGRMKWSLMLKMDSSLQCN